ncbi:heme o synthase [Vibrio vulnificus]|uniref:heme o synthase n=1 Tax=Vibrio vulnificus TaxID=672 RepID=UPI0005F111A5|nr:heme o synthase [Vibrio vulnificus]MBN8032257.1 heme o synthase [Vibrio vulnificus]
MSKTLSVDKPQTRSAWSTYWTLTKPKVVALMLLTSVVGMSLAPHEQFTWHQALIALIGIALMAGSAAAFNHLIDRRIDAKMARTYRRPLPKGDISPFNVLLFALLIGSLGFLSLMLWVNSLTAYLTFASLLGYAVVYTLYLKRATPQNIVIAGIAGAMPPLLGWTSITGELHPHAWLLVMIIFIWTPPHFWALAIHRKEDYAKVNIPMLPVTHGVEYTKTSILLYAILLALVCMLPVLVGMASYLYLFSALVLNVCFVLYAIKLKFRAEERTAIEMFRFSIYFLLLLFCALLLDQQLAG